MNRSDIKLAAYLDEAGEDPQSACLTLKKHNINYAILRETWTGNVCDMSDNGHHRLRKLLEDNDISPIAIASNLGKLAHTKLSLITDKQIDDCINICKYYNSQYLRIYVGEEDKSRDIELDKIYDWVNKATQKCLENNVICLYEITSNSTIFKAVDVVKMLSSIKNLRIIYDSAGLIIKHNFNPFIKHWPLLKNYIDIIDVRDVKIGHGFKVAGFGDSRIDMTINDAVNSNYKGWYAIEPSFGRKFGTANTKEDTFAYAVEGIDKLLEKIKI